MRAARLLVVLAALVALLGGWRAGLAATAAPAVDLRTAAGSDIELVLEAFNAIEQEYYNPVDTTGLLNAAWQAALAAASDPQPPTPDLSQAAGAPSAFLSAYRQLEREGSADPTALAYSTISGMTAFLGNAHTYFLTPSEAMAQRAALAGSDPVGIGVRRTLNGPPWTVLYVAPGSAGEAAGLHAGDVILAYDGDTAPDAPLVNGAGTAGSTLTLTIQRPGEPASRDVTIDLAPYHLPALERRVIQTPAGPIGYLRFFIWESGHQQADAIAAALAGFEQAGVIGWVLDLRANGGGYAEPITDLFAPPSTTIMRVAARGATPVSLIAGDGEQAPARPLAILIGPGSASAAEIVPEALREDGRAILVGERTPGAMATTEEVRLSDGSSLWITHEHVYVGAAGPDLDGVGVSPDICAPETAADLAAGRDPGLDAAVQALSEEAAPVPTAGR